MRNTFIQCLTTAAKTNDKLALIVGDLGYSVVEEFAALYPKRFFNAGVAEQNMIGMAAGLASEGMHVFCYSIANFPTFRCAEQIRNDVAYHSLPVTIVSVGGGVAYGNLGYSHHAVQDYSLLRALPNMTIAAPCDPNEVITTFNKLISKPGPSYLRLGKNGETNHSKKLSSIEIGVPNKLYQGSNSKAIISTGTAIESAIKFRKATNSGDYSLYTLPIWSQHAKFKFAEFISKHRNLITFEDHLIDGGFGSWCLEVNSEFNNNNCKITCKALDAKICGTVGSQSSLLNYGGLC